MPAIRCKACGKTYDPREGFCPKCGAYNRPPRREWVDAGGDVHYAEQEKVCYEQKECHEEKVCYEEQTRRPRPHIRPAAGKSPSSAVAFITVAAVVIMLFAVLRGCVFHNLAPSTPDYPDYDDGWTTVVPSEEAYPERQYVSMGEYFTLRDSAYVVAYTELNHENLTLLAYVVEEGVDFQSFPDLVWVDDDGFEMGVTVDDVTASSEDDGVFLCTYDLAGADVDLTGDIYLVFEDGYTSVWVALPLSA